MRATPRKISLSEMTPTSRPGDSTTGKWRKECCVIKLTTSAKVCSGRIVITLRVITSSTRVVLLLPPLSICRSPFFHGIIATSHEVYHADGAGEKRNLNGKAKGFAKGALAILTLAQFEHRGEIPLSRQEFKGGNLMWDQVRVWFFDPTGAPA